jgi:hypothetical protein
VQRLVRSSTRVLEKLGSPRGRLGISDLIGYNETRLLWRPFETKSSCSQWGHAHSGNIWKTPPFCGSDSPLWVYIYSNIGREFIKYTVIYGHYIRSWQTLNITLLSQFNPASPHSPPILLPLDWELLLAAVEIKMLSSSPLFGLCRLLHRDGQSTKDQGLTSFLGFC